MPGILNGEHKEECKATVLELFASLHPLSTACTASVHLRDLLGCFLVVEVHMEPHFGGATPQATGQRHCDSEKTTPRKKSLSVPSICITAGWSIKHR